MTTLTGFERDRQGIFIRKSPSAILDYTVDWTDWCQTGDYIETCVWSISTISGDASPLVKSSQEQTNNYTCTIYLSGGTDGRVYTVKNTITTINDLVEQREFRVLVENRSV